MKPEKLAQKLAQKKIYQLVERKMISVEEAALQFNVSVEEFLENVNG